jgi:Flp pilus assembly protein TadD
MNKPFAKYLSLVGVVLTAVAAPVKPAGEEIVLEELARDPFANGQRRELKRLRAEYDAAPNNLAAAAKLSRAYIAMGRQEGDPRYISRAEAIVEPFLKGNEHGEMLLIAAIIRQYSHDFSGALEKLDRLAAIDPVNAEGWLNRCTILQVMGRYEEARGACLRLAGKTDQMVFSAAAASLASYTGPLAAPLRTLGMVLERDRGADPATRAWALSILAEIASAAGSDTVAEQALREARRLRLDDSFLKGAWADFLMDHGRFDEACSLLHEEKRNDALLLRYATALKSARAGIEVSAGRQRRVWRCLRNAGGAVCGAGAEEGQGAST